MPLPCAPLSSSVITSSQVKVIVLSSCLFRLTGFIVMKDVGSYSIASIRQILPPSFQTLSSLKTPSKRFVLLYLICPQNLI